MPVIELNALLAPLDDELPRGSNLEYDPAFLELEKKALGEPEVKYGDKNIPAVWPDWKRIRKISTEFLERSRVSLPRK